MHNRNRIWLASFGLTLASVLPSLQAASAPVRAVSPALTMAPATTQITSAISNGKLISLKGTVIAAAQPRFDRGEVSSNLHLGSMTLLLKRSPERAARAAAYAAQLTDPHSPYFHKWLTAKQIGDMFGPSKQDISAVSHWLGSQGLQVTGVDPTGLRVSFTGNVTAVEGAFHTQLHYYRLKGVQYFANATAQSIPAALSPVVVGVASLNNFLPTSQMREVGPVHKGKSGGWISNNGKPSSPLFTNTSAREYAVAPGDFNTIYDVNPLWSQKTPVRGAGQTIAVLERTDILPADIATFRKAFGPANAIGKVTYAQPTNGLPNDASCAAPGFLPDEGEAALDAEWAGAAAPDANVIVASCADSAVNFGPFIAAQNILANNVNNVTIMSLSYGGCEASQGTAGLTQVNGLWQQAALQGVTVFVSTGDSGAAGCDQNQQLTTLGNAVNGLASTPYNVAVGGTDFYDLGVSGQFTGYAKYWSSINAPNLSSAMGYIPEQTWNDSCASSVLAGFVNAQGRGGAQDGESFCNSGFGANFISTGGGSGGVSNYVGKPTWQYGIYGTQNDSARTLPDLSMFAANGLFGHALIYCMSDPNQGGTPCNFTATGNLNMNSAGGTSFAAPALAGVQALVNQSAALMLSGQSLGFAFGNVLPAYYDIGMSEYGSVGSPNAAGLAACNSATSPLAGNGCAFNNITNGDIDEPCLPLSIDCFSRPGHQVGVLSTAGHSQFQAAYPSTAGYNRATGLGSVNASVLAAAFAQRMIHTPYVGAAGDFLGGANTNGPDGNSDFAFINPASNTLVEMGMLSGGTVLQSDSQPIAPGYMIGAMIDLNGDGIADFAFTNPMTNQLYVWLNDGNGGRTAYKVGVPYPAGWTLVGAGKIDQSGNNALIWRNNTSGQVAWWELTFTHGSKMVGVKYSTPLMAAAGYKLTLADLNGDGVLDFVFTGPNNDLYTWINDGTGNFAHHFVGNFPAGWVLEGAGDVNGDGMSDLLFANSSTNQFGWWLMNGNTVISRQTRSITPGYQIASIGDFNGDGLADILWTNAAGDAYVWQSTGAGFQGFRLTDTTGTAVTLPAGAMVQANLLQGNFFNP